MRIFWGLSHHPSVPRSVALGVFDGVHLGHQKVLLSAIEHAQQESLRSTVVTFFPHPMSIVKPHAVFYAVESLEVRLKRIAALGINEVVVLPFDTHMASMSADTFIKEILLHQLQSKHLSVGEGFKFGNKQSGSVEMLKKEPRVATHSIGHVWVNGGDVSSTRIRTLVQQGHVDIVPALLGRYFTHTGVVVHGHQRGRSLGFPTANITPNTPLHPHVGVYAAWIDCSGQRYAAVVNVGTSPTFLKTHAVRIEAHILDYPGDSIYHTEVSLHYVKKLRDEHSFGSVDDLKKAITHDIAQARTFLKTTAP